MSDVGYLKLWRATIGGDPDCKISRSTMDEIVSTMNWALQRLTPRERKVLVMNYGLVGQKRLSCKKIGKLLYSPKKQSMGVSVSRVQQIATKAIRRLRHPRLQLDRRYA